MTPLFGLPKPAAAGMAAALTVLGLAATPAAAHDADMDLYYNVYIGGFHVVDLKVDLGLDPHRYAIRTNLHTSGMIGRLFPWSMVAFSHGALDGDRAVPVSARQGNTWRGKQRYIDLTFRDGVPRVDAIKPKSDEEGRKKVPEAMRAGAVDLTSAIMTIIARVDDGKACKDKIPVFDGRRRYDLMVRPDGTDQLRASSRSPFSGKTINCIVWIERKAGFKNDEHSGWSTAGNRAQVWMGRAFGGAPRVPVRLTFQTPYGALIAHLNRATMVKGNQTQALNRTD